MQNSSLWRAARPYPHSAFLGAKYFQGHQNPLENSASTWELRSWGRVSKIPHNSGLWARLFSPLLQSTFSYLWLVLICCTWITTEIAFRCSAPSQAEQLELASVWSLKNPPCPAWATVVCWVLFFVGFFFPLLQTGSTWYTGEAASGSLLSEHFTGYTVAPTTKPLVQQLFLIARLKLLSNPSKSHSTRTLHMPITRCWTTQSSRDQNRVRTFKSLSPVTYVFLLTVSS